MNLVEHAIRSGRLGVGPAERFLSSASRMISSLREHGIVLGEALGRPQTVESMPRRAPDDNNKLRLIDGDAAPARDPLSESFRVVRVALIRDQDPSCVRGDGLVDVITSPVTTLTFAMRQSVH